MSKNWFVINKSTTAAEVIVSGFIGPYDKVDYSGFKTALSQLKEEGYVKAKLKLNSGGGDMIEGFAIYDAAVESGIEFDVQIVGMAASMATVLMLVGNELPAISKHGRIMTHKPKAGAYGESDNLRTMADLADDLEKKAIALFMEKTGADEETVKSWMQPGKDKWFDAKAALKAGLVREIIDTGEAAPATAKPAKGATPEQVWQSVYNQITLNNPTDMVLPKSTYDKLKLPESATEAQVTQAVNDLVTRAETAENKVTTLEEAAKTEKTVRATALVEAAITAKKILPADKADYIQMATDNYPMAEKVLAKMQGVNLPTNGIKPETPVNTEERKDWKFEDWNQKDYAGLAQMKAEEPEKHAALLKDYTTRLSAKK